MKIILSGYGTMSKIVEEVAIEKGHEIVGVFSKVPIESKYKICKDITSLPESDVIIDFSHPDNISYILENENTIKTPLVIATTGDRKKLKKLMKDATKFCPVFFSANMSYGVHVFTKALQFLTPLLSENFDIEILEKHHNKKIDSPSGTAIKLLETIKEIDPSFNEIYDRTTISRKREKKEIGMSSIRGGTIVGEHQVIFAGNDEVIELTHTAQSKRIFAEGAIKAAESIINKKPGFYNFDNLK